MAKTGDAVTNTTNVAGSVTDANKASNAADTANAASKAPEPKGPNGIGNGGKIKYRRPKKRIKCFCVQDNAKGGRDEYDRQLKKQQEGINSMSASDYLAERKAYTGKDPCNGYKPTESGATKVRDPSITKNAKSKRLKDQSKKYAEEMRSNRTSRSEAKRLGRAKATREKGMQDALHNQDMVAGGHDVIGSLSADGSRTLGDEDFGLSDTNRHIGSQWNGDRIRGIDMEACQMNKAGLGEEKLNVELR